MENKEEKVVVSIPEWSIVEDYTFTENLANKNRADSKKSKTSIVEILKREKLLTVWNMIFVLVCVTAVSLDPLFFYVPMINRKMMCIKMDEKLETSAVVLRSLTDIFYLIDIAYNVVKALEILKKEGHGLMWKRGQLAKNALAVAQRLSWFVVVVDFLAILPVPQITILVFLERVKTSGSSGKRWLNAVLLSQYVPRIFRIYLSCKELTETLDQVTRIVWVKGGLNLFLYILASHVFGGFWYFFSFQRETSCWHRACKDDGNCKPSTYSCDDGASGNEALLKSKCPVNPKNETEFDFGIFLGALQSGIMESSDFPQKLFNCFWWGLRNLSSLGQNLETSDYIWENCFAVSISIIGLLLFLYLIGNLQTYMQLATTKSEEIGEKLKLKERDIDLWIMKNGLPKEMKTSIMQKVKHKLKKNKEVDVENLLSILPHDDRKSIKQLLCLPMLKKIPIFQNMNDQVLAMICNHLKPVIYNESTCIIREGDPLDRMLFISQGTAWAYTNTITHDHVNSINGDSTNRSTSSNTETRRLRRGDYFGEELLQWSLTHTTISEFPISTTNVKSHTKVEAFAFMANDLMNAVSRFWWAFRQNLPADLTNSQAGRWETSAVSAMQTLRRSRMKKKTANSAAAQLTEGGGGKSQRFKYRRLHH